MFDFHTNNISPKKKKNNYMDYTGVRGFPWATENVSNRQPDT